jgi:predicted DNA-binding protein (MmcQ/YjbR family)
MSLQWGDHQVYKVGGKMFAVLSGRGTASFKANDIAFEMLVELGQARPSPYMVRAQWLYVDDIRQFPPAELRQYIAASHALVAKKLTKKAQRELGLAG